jgi:transposase
MKQYSEAFIGFDTAKKKHAVAIADVGREGEIRYLGEIDSSPAAVERMIRKLAGRYEKLHFCYEAGPDRVRVVPPASCSGSPLRCRRAILDPEEIGRAARQNQSA